MKDASNTRAARVESSCKDPDEKPQRKSVRQEPRSDPTGRLSPKDLDSLSDEQLRKLTKANTKKNHGGRSSRIRSQVERVFRRLDNLAADVRLQPRYSIDALPVVSPNNDSHVADRESLPASGAKNRTSNDKVLKENLGRLNSNKEIEAKPRSPMNSVSQESEQILDALQIETNEFEIEPATQNSEFTDSTTSINTASGSGRSVRISTSVTVLDYIPQRPVSVARLDRYEHPTRTGKCLQTRKMIAEEMDFPQFTIRRHDDNRGAANENKENVLYRRRSTAEGAIVTHQRPSPPPPRRVHSTGSTVVECVIPAPRGAYGSRANKA